MYEIVKPRTMSLQNDRLQRLGFLLPFLTDARPPSDVKQYLLAQCTDSNQSELERQSKENPEWGVIALVDGQIET